MKECGYPCFQIILRVYFDTTFLHHSPHVISYFLKVDQTRLFCRFFAIFVFSYLENMKYPIVSVLFFILAIPIFGNSKIDSLLQVLDHAIAQSEVFENSKKDRIGTIKEQLLQYPISDDESYRVNDLLYQEYEFYISDSARHYIDRCINIAWKNNDGSRLAHSKIRKANLLATAGLYPEAIELLYTVDASFLSRQDSARYYLAFEHTYLYHAEYVGGDEVIGKYLASRDIYRDSALMLLPESSYLYTITKAVYIN